MDTQRLQLTTHETLELHELLGSKMALLKKLKANKTMVQDQDLAQFIEDSLSMKKSEIQELQNFLGTQGIGTMQ